MLDFLAITLSGHPPKQTRGATPGIEWQWLDEGILMLTPVGNCTQSVVLSAGIHGNETAPIEILNQLVSDLLAGELTLAVRLLVIFGNPAAISAGKRYLSADINRMFGGRHRRYPSGNETRRVEIVEQAVSAFFRAESQLTRQHYDLHTAIRGSHHTRFGLLPYQTTPYSAAMLRWLQDIQLDALVMHTSAGGTFAHFSSEHCQAASCTLELGKALPFGENQLAEFTHIVGGLRSLVSEEPLPVQPSGGMVFYRVVQSLLKQHPDFKLWVDEETVNFTRFSQGTLLAEQSGEHYRVKHKEEWILFPNPQVALGLRAGIMLVRMDKSEIPTV